MDVAELKYWLALLKYPGVGPVKSLQILREFNSAQEIFKQGKLLTYIINKYGLIQQDINWRLIEADLLWAEQKNNYIITIKCLHYPALLQQIYAPPPVLYLSGNINILCKPAIAMVGSRKASLKGLTHAFNFANNLSKLNFNIVSGLAVGIDTACHQGAILSGTTAVLPSGVNCIYPPQNVDLAKKIQENGLLLSEFSPHINSIASNFVRRNRLISGLSLAVVMIEAKIKSGSMITAKYAIEQNRELCVLPWQIDDEAYSGNHLLLQDGANLVVNIDQIIQAINYAQ